MKTSEAQSITPIARHCVVSPATVQRVIDQTAKTFKPYYRTLPKHLSFDEFKYAKGKMAFEYVDAETGNILDILSEGTNYTMKNNCSGNYRRQDLRNVETETSDMNAGYMQ